MQITVQDIAALVGGRVHGDGSVCITGVNGLKEAAPGEICFVRGTRYLPLLETSAASAVFINEVPEWLSIPAIVVGQPDLAFAMLLKHCETESLIHPTGIHPTAVVDATATLGVDVALDARVVIAPGAVLGDRVVIYAGAYIGRNVHIGDDTVIYPNVVLREDTTLGRRCIIHAGAILGSDGFGFAPLGGQWMKIPQVGRVQVGDDVEIGSNTTIDRATFGVTRIGTGTKIDNLVQVGHNCEIGEHCAIAGMAGLAGSTVLKNHVRVGASAGVAGHIELGEGATVGARSGVTHSVAPGQTVLGYPADDLSKTRRVWAANRRTPEMLRRIRQLEHQLEALEKKA